MILASKPGQPSPKIEKRADDVRVVQIDCKELLEPNELIYSKINIKGADNIIIDNVRTKQGKYLFFRASAGGSALVHTDHKLVFNISTSLGSTISVPVLLRVFQS